MPDYRSTVSNVWPQSGRAKLKLRFASSPRTGVEISLFNFGDKSPQMTSTVNRVTQTKEAGQASLNDNGRLHVALSNKLKIHNFKYELYFYLPKRNASVIFSEALRSCHFDSRKSNRPLSWPPAERRPCIGYGCLLLSAILNCVLWPDRPLRGTLGFSLDTSRPPACASVVETNLQTCPPC